ncbi:G-protein beta WD-40 repeat [Beggiatoa sp. PS]|nr:G-protein beta WD-40 repeat [Beggiatoa sp. PS]
MPSNHNLLILVDQFEELFHHANKSEKEREEINNFIQWLLTSCQHYNSKIYVVITMRPEFLDDCAQYENLIWAINHGFFQVPHLTKENLKETIELPARVYEGSIEPILVERLLSDIENIGKINHFDHLLLLQHALLTMWLKVNDNNQKILTLQHYQEIGNDLAVALNQSAEAAYLTFQDTNKKVVEILFRRISRSDGKGNYTRDPVQLKNLANLAEVSWQTVSDIIDHFRISERRFLLSRNKLFGYLQANDEIDIAHESIIRQWKRLKQWADEEAECAKFYNLWEKTAQRWQARQGELWHKLDLENALDSVTRIQRLYPKSEQLKAWASRYGQNFDLAWKFLGESKKAQEQQFFAEDSVIKSELAQQVVEKPELAKQASYIGATSKPSWQRIKIAITGSLGIFVAGWRFWKRYRGKYYLFLLRFWRERLL